MARTSEKKVVAQLLHSHQPHSHAVFFFTQPRNILRHTPGLHKFSKTVYWHTQAMNCSTLDH